jgi:hypothetical protein
MTLSIAKLSIMALIITRLIITIPRSLPVKHKYYAKCRNLSLILSLFMLNVIIQNVAMLSVIMLKVLELFKGPIIYPQSQSSVLIYTGVTYSI